MPDAAEIHPFVLELFHLDDLGMLRHAFDEGIFDRDAQAAGEGHVLVGIERLIAKEQHQVLVPGPTDLGRLLSAQGLTQIDALYLGAQGASHAAHGNGSVFSQFDDPAGRSSLGSIGEQVFR